MKPSLPVCTLLRFQTGYKKMLSHEFLDSQRDDPRGEGPGDSLGIHTEGTVFGAGASRRTAGDLGGSPRVWFPRQAKTQTQNQHAYHPSGPKLQHPWAGGVRSHVSELLEVCPQWLVERRRSACLTTPAVLIMLRAETAWERDRGWVTEIGREGGGGESPMYPLWVWVLCSFPGSVQSLSVSTRSCCQRAHCRNDEQHYLLRTWTCRQCRWQWIIDYCTRRKP